MELNNEVEQIGITIPARRDAKRAVQLAQQLSQQIAMETPTEIVVVDNGDNPGIDEANSLPGVSVVCEPKLGPGNARSAGLQKHLARWSNSHDLERCWIVSLDADAAVSADYIATWVDSIRKTHAPLIAGHSIFSELAGGHSIPESLEVASRWAWEIAGRCEDLIGVVNVGGCNHVVRADVAHDLGGYNQPFARGPNGDVELLAGDDWDFGLRARISGVETARVHQPTCLTSNRRLACDPVGFLTGACYEGAFAPVERYSTQEWPPIESWPSIKKRSAVRLVGHFLVKPAMCGIPLEAKAQWLLGEDLEKELEIIESRSVSARETWNDRRSDLIVELFSPAAIDLAGRIVRRLQG